MIQVGCAADFDIAEVRPLRDAFAAWAPAGYLGGRGEKFLPHLVFGEDGPVGEEAPHTYNAMLQFLDAGQVAFLAVVDEVVDFALVFVWKLFSVDGIVESFDQGPAAIVAQVAMDNLFLPILEGPINLRESLGK